jgi:hypothetical protein
MTDETARQASYQALIPPRQIGQTADVGRGEATGEATGGAEAWQDAPLGLRLVGSEIHVWRAELDRTPEVTVHYQRMLSTDERSRVDALRFPRDASRATIARGVLRSLLGRYLDCAPETIRLRYGSQGKPALVRASGQPDLRFNLTHAQGLALYAFSLGREVGIDLEYMADNVDATLIAHRFFSPAELRALCNRIFPRQAARRTTSARCHNKAVTPSWRGARYSSRFSRSRGSSTLLTWRSPLYESRRCLPSKMVSRCTGRDQM